jgi:hypothetical protein
VQVVQIVEEARIQGCASVSRGNWQDCRPRFRRTSASEARGLEETLIPLAIRLCDVDNQMDCSCALQAQRDQSLPSCVYRLPIPGRLLCANTGRLGWNPASNSEVGRTHFRREGTGGEVLVDVGRHWRRGRGSKASRGGCSHWERSESLKVQASRRTSLVCLSTISTCRISRQYPGISFQFSRVAPHFISKSWKVRHQ